MRISLVSVYSRDDDLPMFGIIFKLLPVPEVHLPST